MEEIDVDIDTNCNICYAEFLDLEDLEIHKEQVHNSKTSKVPCQFCSVTHRDIEEYASHIRNHHIKQLNMCEVCTRIFLDKDEHRKHVIKHHQHPNKCSYTCSQCGFNSKSAKILENHELTLHRNVKDGVFINECLPHLSSLLNINALKFIQLIKQDRAYVCTKCESSYLNADDYIDHLKINNCRSYTCNYCCYVYRKKRGLIKHLHAHKECSLYVSEKQLKQCSKCLEYVPRHLLMEHKKNCMIIKCTQCKVFFHNVEELSKHQIEEHASAISLQICKYCKKEFVGKKSLQNHFKRTHENQLHLYKYVCVYCDAIFKHPKSLFGHFFTRHKDLQPYTCKLCDKTFRIRKNFSIHIKLEHKSVGFVEFDENYHVFFTDKKSDNPFKPHGKRSTDTEDSETVIEDTDVSTKEDVAEKRSRNLKRKSNSRFKDSALADENNDKDSEDKIHNDDSDFTYITETEGNQTEPEIKEPKQVKRKLRPRNGQKKVKRNISNDEVILSSSDDEPLLAIKKKVQMKLRAKNKNTSLNRFPTKKMSMFRETANRFKCNYCDKQCYTFHNYHQHLNSYHKDEMTKCIKCDISFPTKQHLSDHMTQEHSSSRLTEVLKAMIEKRKNESTNPDLIPNIEKFRKTIKKVKCDINVVPATVTPCDNGKSTKLSVQKFIENFTPEGNEVEKNKIIVESNISIRPVRNVYKPPLIKLHKFESDTKKYSSLKPKLAMPVKFKPDGREDPVVTVTMVQNSLPKPKAIVDESDREETFYNDIPDHNYDDHNYEEVTDHIDHETDDVQEYRIPEVAEEVMLEGSEEVPKVQKSHKIVISNVPKEINKMRIAHLLPVAPFFKIVKIKDVIGNTEHQKQEESTANEPKVVKLPDGTKLVNVNPLAHLLGDKKVLDNYVTNKYYTRKTQNFEQAVAKALMKVEKSTPKKGGKKKKNAKKEQADEETEIFQ